MKPHHNKGLTDQLTSCPTQSSIKTAGNTPKDNQGPAKSPKTPNPSKQTNKTPSFCNPNQSTTALIMAEAKEKSTKWSTKASVVIETKDSQTTMPVVDQDVAADKNDVKRKLAK